MTRDANGSIDFRHLVSSGRMAFDFRKAGGQIWEHYTPNLDIDWDYNKDDPGNLYRPWGFQPGHQTEWSKLLLMLHHRKALQDD